MKLYMVFRHFIDKDELYSVHDSMENAQTMIKNVIEKRKEEHGIYSIYENPNAFFTIEETTMNIHDRTLVFSTKQSL